MGGTNPAVLGLLCLLSRAVLPGFAQEVSTNQSADLGTEVPPATTVPPIVNSTVLDESRSIVSGSPDPRGGKDNETIAVTGPPPSEGPPPSKDPPPSEGPSTIAASESNTETSAITGAPREANGSSDGPPTSQGYTDPGTRGVTGPNLTQPPPTAHTMTASVTENVTAGTPGSLTESPLPPGTQNNTESPPVSTQPAATTTADLASAATTDLVIASAVATTQPADPTTTQTAATPETGRPEVLRDPSVLEVGDHKDVPGFHSGSGSNPLFVMIVSVFTIMVVMVVVAVGFHRYKKRNRRTDFRRLHDLPMDDMMEDTPLALYSY